ncbi:hypothetical protein [Gimesia sp.]|uniref:hypothetical protein n=1 Tax=Gimesia sp. TaxID=2024833 RepID=UPI003A9429ED
MNLFRNINRSPSFNIILIATGFMLLIVICLTWLYLSRLNELKQAQKRIEEKYQTEFDALKTVALNPEHPTGMASFKQIDELELKLSADDFWRVDSLYDHLHGGSIIKSSPNQEGFIRGPEYLHSKNSKGDTLYYAYTTDGEPLFWYELKVPKAKAMRLFLIHIRRDCVLEE